MSSVTEAEEIAVIGIGCRVPGADNIEEFWRVLENGENHVVDIPPERWNNEHFYSDSNEPGKSYVKKAGLLKCHDEWDNEFFNVSKDEAKTVDPQQRWVLECSHMAFEDAGITRDQLNGSNTGVFIGAMNDDYKGMYNSTHEEDTVYSATGMSSTYISARVSHVYNLQGQCLTVDTACSSSMMAIHMGCQSIRAGDCTMAVCGGVNSILNPDQFVVLCKAGMLSRTGQCQTFCETADGYARGEGCGIVILKSYKHALQDGNTIWGLLKTGTNQDGRTALSMAAPSSDQQEELLKKMYKQYNMNPASLQYIEAHGTGTRIGDPVETAALGKFIKGFQPCPKSNGAFDELPEKQATSDMTQQREYATSPIRIGSVKTNIGHLESAAGVVSLIKILLMMKHGRFVPSLHIRSDMSNLNKEIKLEESGLAISVDNSDWPANETGERHGCLNCFGFGGSNTHAIVTSSTKYQQRQKEPNGKSDIKVISLSATNKESLSQMMKDLYKALETDRYELSDLSYTSLHKRDHFPYRILLFGRSHDDIRNQIVSRKEAELEQLKPAGPNQVIFFFCGVGALRQGMCKIMMRTSPIFRSSIVTLDGLLKPLTGWSVLELFLLNKEIDDPFMNHIALFCLQIALYETCKSLGVIPHTIIGQSAGEIPAAYASGALTLEEAVELVYTRSLALSKCTGGSMLVVSNIDVKEVEQACTSVEEGVTIAVYNSPTSCTLSGERSVLEELRNYLNERKTDILFKPLNVQCAYHSKFTEPCLDEFRSNLVTLNPKAETVKHISTVTGGLVDGSDLQNPEYWVNNIRRPVKLMDAVQASVKDNKTNIFVEIGPTQVLKSHLKNIVTTNKTVSLPTMADSGDVSCLYHSLSFLHSMGAEINWDKIIRHGEITPIPRYAFNKSKCLHISSKRMLYLQGAEDSKDKHMFVRQIQTGGDRFYLTLYQNTAAFVYEHFIFGRPLVPGSYYVEAAFHIGCYTSHWNAHEISVEVEFLKSVNPDANQSPMEVVESIDGSVASAVKRQWFVCQDGAHVCKLTVKPRPRCKGSHKDIKQIQSRCLTHRTKDESYECLKSMNFTYGESLQLMNQTWSSYIECLTEFYLPEAFLEERKLTHLHPSVLDGLFQSFGVINNSHAGQTFLPKHIDSVTLNRPIQKHMFGHAKIVRTCANGLFYDAMLLTPAGDVIAEVNNFFLRRMSDAPETDPTLAYQLIWNESALPTASKNQNIHSPRKTLVLGDKQFFDKLTSGTKTYADFDALGGDGDINLESYNVVLVAAICPNDVLSGASAYKSIYEQCQKVFRFVKKLIENVRKHAFDGPMFIVTENAIPSSKDRPISPMGAMLWGMIRSAMHEFPNIDLHIVDIDLNIDSLVVLHNLTHSASLKSPEMIIRNGTVFSSEMVTVDTHRIPDTTVTPYSPHDRTVLMSNASSSIEDPFFAINAPERRLDNNESKCTLRLKNICLHDPSLYPITLDDDDDENMIENDARGSTVVCVEGVGQSLGDTDSDIGFCFPTNVTNPLAIPTTCTFERTQIPAIPGIVTISVLLHGVSQVYIDYNRSCVVIDEKVTSRSLVEYIFHKTTCRTVQVYDKTTSDACKGELAVLLTTLTREQLRRMVNANHEAKWIVTYEQMVSRRTRVWFQQTFPQIKIDILKTDEILTESLLADIVPSVADQLKEMGQDVRARVENDIKNTQPKHGEMFHLPYHTLDVMTVPLKLSEHQIFRKSCCYINVGGLKGLGWELTQFMAELGAGYIATIHRNPPNESQLADIIDLEIKTGCKVLPFSGDITVLGQVKGIVNKLIETLGDEVGVKGVLHGAGVIDDVLLTNMTEESIERVLGPKVLGTMNLHEATKSQKLDFFIMHSSIVSVIGNPGQCNYAAGNSFMDAFAYYRRSLGLCAQSINWSALSVGMAAEHTRSKKLVEKGLALLSVDEIRRCFTQAIMTNQTNIAFGKFDWQQLSESMLTMNNPQKYATLTGVTKSLKSKKHQFFDLDIFWKGNSESRLAMIHDLVKTTVENVFASVIELTNDMVFGTLGIDSMASMHFVDYIQKATKVQIQISQLYLDTTTIGSLCSFILERMSNTSCNSAIETDSTEISDQMAAYLDGDVPFTQVSLLDDFKKDPFTKNIMRQVDMEVKGKGQIFRLEDWTVILDNLLKIEPELCRIFHVDTKPYRSSIIRHAKMPIEVVSFDSLEHVTDERHTICMDITKCVPVCVKMAISGNTTRFRFFLHGVLGDLPAVTTIFQQFSRVTRGYAESKLPDPKPELISPKDAFKGALIPKASSLQRFWSGVNWKDIEPFTLGDNLECGLDEAHWTEIAAYIPKDIAQAIIEDHHISVYNYIASAYMALLHKESGKNFIPLVTYVDMRAHVPELQESIISCSNGTPVLGDFRNLGPKTTVADYLKTSADLLNNITQNSAYPYDLILNEMHSDELRNEIGRHRIIMENLTYINQIMNMEGHMTKYKMFFKRHVYETSLHVMYDKTNKEIALEFGYNGSVVSECVARRILVGLVHIIGAFRTRPEASVVDILEGLDSVDDGVPISVKHTPIQSG